MTDTLSTVFPFDVSFSLAMETCKCQRLKIFNETYAHLVRLLIAQLVIHPFSDSIINCPPPCQPLLVSTRIEIRWLITFNQKIIYYLIIFVKLSEIRLLFIVAMTKFAIFELDIR